MFLFKFFTNDLAYKLDSRSKLLIILLFSILIFGVDRLSASVFLLITFIVIRFVMKIPFRGMGYFKNLTLLAFFIIIMQTLFFPGENYILKPLFPVSFPLLGGMGSLKWEGLYLGLVISCRLFSLMIILPFLMETTPAYNLATGINALGFNYRAAFIVTFSLNLIPVFKEEAAVIMDAQKLRGMSSFDKGRFFARLKGYAGLAVPLMLGAMKKAQVSSIAMDTRAFGVYKTRTWLDKPKMKVYDFTAIFVCLIFTVFFLMTDLFRNFSF